MKKIAQLFGKELTEFAETVPMVGSVERRQKYHAGINRLATKVLSANPDEIHDINWLRSRRGEFAKFVSMSDPSDRSDIRRRAVKMLKMLDSIIYDRKMDMGTTVDWRSRKGSRLSGRIARSGGKSRGITRSGYGRKKGLDMDQIRYRGTGKSYRKQTRSGSGGLPKSRSVRVNLPKAEKKTKHLNDIFSKATTIHAAVNTPVYLQLINRKDGEVREVRIPKDGKMGKVLMKDASSLNPKWSEFKSSSKKKTTAGSRPKSQGESILAESAPDLNNTCKHRHFNMGIFPTRMATHQVPRQVPLKTEVSYFLGVNIGCFWGLGDEDTTLPGEFEKVVEKVGMVVVDINVSCPDAIMNKTHGKLKLKKEGNTKLLFFEFAFPSPGNHKMEVSLLAGNRPIQNYTLTMEVVGQDEEIVLRTANGPLEEILPEDQLKELLLPALTSNLTYSNTSEFTVEEIQRFQQEARKLTIMAYDNPTRGGLDLSFFQEGKEVLMARATDLSQTNLGNRLRKGRDMLQKVMNDYSDHLLKEEPQYTDEQLDRRMKYGLGGVADAGRSFFIDLFGMQDNPPKTSEESTGIFKLLNQLDPGDTIQVAPLGNAPGVPWEILYDRKAISFREDEVELCDTWQSHGPAPWDCPYNDREEVICPHGFWGFRFVIEQLPSRKLPSLDKVYASPPDVIPNESPFRINVLNYETEDWPNHLAKLRNDLPGSKVDLVTHPVPEVKNAFGRQNHPDLIYFYAHGGLNEYEEFYLKVGNETKPFLIKKLDLDSYVTKQLQARGYLVFLNTCHSSESSPESLDNITKFFFDKSALGVLGTQCEVPEDVADYFFREFMKLFLSGSTLGKALFEVRWKMLRERKDPRSLIYSMFAPDQIRLDNPVLEKYSEDEPS